MLLIIGAGAVRVNLAIRERPEMFSCLSAFLFDLVATFADGAFAIQALYGLANEALAMAGQPVLSCCVVMV